MRGRGTLAGLLLPLAITMAVAGCQGEVGDIVGLARRVVPNDWVLQGISPDGRVLRVATFYGGEASDCNRWVGAEVNERDDRVSVRMLLSQRIAPSACTDEGITRAATVSLREPLGDRDLVGCGAEPPLCRATPREGALAGWEPPRRQVEVGAGLVVVSDEAGLAALEADTGRVRWQRAPIREHAVADVLWVDEAVVGVVDGDAAVVAFDALTGQERWRVQDPGKGVVAAPSSPKGDAALFHTDATGALVARDRRSGQVRWQVAVGEGRPARLAAGAGTVAVLLEPLDRQGPPSATVAAFGAADGAPLWRHTVPERLGSLAVADATVLAGGPIVRYGSEAPTGNRRWRAAPFAEHATLHTTVEGAAALHTNHVWELVLFDAVSGAERRRLSFGEAAGVRVQHEAVLVSTRDGAAEVRGLDGAPRLRVPLGGIGGAPALDGGVLAVPTHIGVSVFGEGAALRWWHLRELPQERPPAG